MGKLMDFLMEGKAGDTVTAEVQIAGFPAPFIVKSISEGENKAIRKSCQSISFDKRTHQKSVETDTDLYNNKLVAACCVEPNFKDADLQAKYGVIGAESLIDRILQPWQFTDLLVGIQETNGFKDDINELRNEAKN
ncbi:Phage XkdN-like tail assembly chaperone protein, TAC [anaerobic digester metagenome]